MAISQGGLFTYYSTQAWNTQAWSGGDPKVLPVFQQDNKTGTTTRLAEMAIPSFLDTVYTVRGGINPTDGIYWVSSSVESTHYFWAYNTLTKVNYGYVGSITGTTTMSGTNGDLVFDQDGNMLIVTSESTGSYLNRVTGMNATLAAGSTGAARDLTLLVGIAKVTTLGSGSTNVYNGITFDNDGLLWMQYYSGATAYIAGFDPNTGARAKGPFSLSGTSTSTGATRTATDLADCNDPGGIRLQKVYEGRADSADNVTLKISRSDAPTVILGGGTATTNGPPTGLQVNATAVVIGVPGKTYILKESAIGSALDQYSTTLECVDKTHGNLPIAAVRTSQGEYRLDFPSVSTKDGQALANVVCTYTNTPNGTLQLSKQLDGDRADDADQFRVRILNSPQGTVAKSGTADAIATTTGTGSMVLTGTTPVVRAQTLADGGSQSYTFDELGWRDGVHTDSVLASYPNPTLTCTDAAGVQPEADLPVDMLLSQFQSITPKPGSQVSCVITNHAANTQFHVEKQGNNCDVGQDTCALNGARFALYDTDPSAAGAKQIVDGITADMLDGATFTSKKLQAGTYWLVETKAPTGFTLLPEPIKFTLTSTGITLADPGSGLASIKDGDALTILVTDTTPAPLPEAGGAGPWPFYAVGLLLLVGAGLYHQMTSVRRVAP